MGIPVTGMAPDEQIRYQDAGVDIDRADRALARIRRHVRSTLTPGVLTSIGAFGAGFRLSGFKDPVLVSSADGVGTKLKVAFLSGRHDTVGEDLVNHCVNDIMVQGARPLFFLDYFSVGKLDPAVAERVVAGIARACRANGCALIGGETAEMPGLYAPGEYDLAGFVVGAVERKSLLTGASIRAGDVLLGLPSTGLHTNGYSLARKLLFEVAGLTVDSVVAELGCTVGEELLKVHRSYRRPLSLLFEAGILKGAAHITGGGITDNLPRILPPGLGAEIDTAAWRELPVFRLLREIGRIPEDDCRRTFNLGVGMVLAVSPRRLAQAEALLKRAREPFRRIGGVVSLPRRARARVIYR
jgi:phosphoribosylformylglycinamidine cyclo-ligase